MQYIDRLFVILTPGEHLLEKKNNGINNTSIIHLIRLLPRFARSS
jgi:hypothetical protein